MTDLLFDPMRLVFAGTPAFAAAALEALIEAGHQIDLVLTQPDRPAGRGMKLLASDVKKLALERGLAIAQPATLRDNPEAIEQIVETEAQAMIVAAYGLILPRNLLDVFPKGCINIHASLLPRWRGAAPIQRALLAGDSKSGISIMRMDEGLDTGPVFTMETIEIEPRETSASLHDKLALLGGRSIVKALAGIESGELQAIPQAEEGVTYASKVNKKEARLDWSQSAANLERAIRAYNPFPVAFSVLGGQIVKVWEAELLPEFAADPGQIADVSETGIVVGCGRGALRLTVLQRSGGKKLPVSDFLRGFPVESGQRFEN